MADNEIIENQFVNLVKFSCGCVINIENDEICINHPDAKLIFTYPHYSKLPYCIVATGTRNSVNRSIVDDIKFSIHRCKKDKYNYIDSLEKLPVSDNNIYSSKELLLPEAIRILGSEELAYELINDLCTCICLNELENYPYLVDKVEDN